MNNLKIIPFRLGVPMLTLIVLLSSFTGAMAADEVTSYQLYQQKQGQSIRQGAGQCLGIGQSPGIGQSTGQSTGQGTGQSTGSKVRVQCTENSGKLLANGSWQGVLSMTYEDQILGLENNSGVGSSVILGDSGHSSASLSVMPTQALNGDFVFVLSLFPNDNYLQSLKGDVEHRFLVQLSPEQRESYYNNPDSELRQRVALKVLEIYEKERIGPTTAMVRLDYDKVSRGWFNRATRQSAFPMTLTLKYRLKKSKGHWYNQADFSDHVFSCAIDLI